MAGKKLSEQGKASLRFFVNSVAVKAGLVYPSSIDARGWWQITPEGRNLITPNMVSDEEETEETINLDTQESITVSSNTVRGTAFELYVLRVLKLMQPLYSWYHQGQHKTKERGLDFIGSQIGNIQGQPQFIGVQVKFHAANTAPSQLEWFKFLAGCFARRIDHALFITTGRLTSEQRREAGEARVIVIEGRDEITRIAHEYRIEPFDLFDENIS